jgi:hypothetical protein
MVGGQVTRRRRPLIRSVAAFVTAATAAAWPLVAQAAEDAPTPAAARPLSAVFEGVVGGDVVVAANSNLGSAGGSDVPDGSVADVDRDRTVLLCCSARRVDSAYAHHSWENSPNGAPCQSASAAS